MRDYRQNPPTVEDIYMHLLFTVQGPNKYNKMLIVLVEVFLN